MATYLEDLREDVLLHVCIMHAYGTASDLHAVQHEIVMLATYLRGE